MYVSDDPYILVLYQYTHSYYTWLCTCTHMYLCISISYFLLTGTYYSTYMSTYICQDWYTSIHGIICVEILCIHNSSRICILSNIFLHELIILAQTRENSHAGFCHNLEYDNIIKAFNQSLLLVLQWRPSLATAATLHLLSLPTRGS